MTKWYVLQSDQSVRGPFREGQIRQGIRAGSIHTPMRIRQGNSGWIRTEKVRRLFERLDAEGVFVKNAAGSIYGPFTRERLQCMQAANQLPQRYWLRQGKQGPWHAVRPTSSVANSSVKAASLSGPRPFIPPAPVMKLRPTPWSAVMAQARCTFGRLLPSYTTN